MKIRAVFYIKGAVRLSARKACIKFYTTFRYLFIITRNRLTIENKYRNWFLNAHFYTKHKITLTWPKFAQCWFFFRFQLRLINLELLN